MPKIARIAYIVAFVVAGLTVISGLLGPIVILPAALIPLIAGIGIMRRRVWSAYGFAIYLFGQLFFVPFVLFRHGGNTTGLAGIHGGAGWKETSRTHATRPNIKISTATTSQASPTSTLQSPPWRCSRSTS